VELLTAVRYKETPSSSQTNDDQSGPSSLSLQGTVLVFRIYRAGDIQKERVICRTETDVCHTDQPFEAEACVHDS
jgi:hypothetical protein